MKAIIETVTDLNFLPNIPFKIKRSFQSSHAQHYITLGQSGKTPEPKMNQISIFLLI